MGNRNTCCACGEKRSASEEAQRRQAKDNFFDMEDKAVRDLQEKLAEVRWNEQGRDSEIYRNVVRDKYRKNSPIREKMKHRPQKSSISRADNQILAKKKGKS